MERIASPTTEFPRSETDEPPLRAGVAIRPRVSIQAQFDSAGLRSLPEGVGAGYSAGPLSFGIEPASAGAL